MPIVNPSGSPAIPNVTTFASVSLFSDVRALGAGQYPAVEVLGGTVIGDGYDGIFYWSSTSVAADDAATVLAPNAGGTGRWVRMYGGLSLSTGSSHVGTIQSGTGAVARTVQAKERETKSVLDFGLVGDGTTNNVAALLVAQAAAYAGPFDLYWPAGNYLLSTSPGAFGNTVTNAAIPVRWFGDGYNSVIKVTAASITPILFQGPTPDTDGAGNRITAGIIIENMAIRGPGYYGGGLTGTGIKFYGVQGITLRNVEIRGWGTGEYYQNVDIVSRVNVKNTSNDKGVDSTATGYASASGGQMNSFNSLFGQITNCTTWGIKYYGGINPCWYGVNFAANGKSMVISPTDGGNSPVTASPKIDNCFFENDTSNTITLGGGTGIVNDPIIEPFSIIATAAVPAILVSNAANTGTGQRGRINGVFTLSGGATDVNQATSAGKIDYKNINGMPIGDITPAAITGTAISGTTVSATTSLNSSATPSANWGVNFAPSTALPVTAAGTYAFAVGSGLVVVHDDSNGDAGVFICYGGIVTKLGGAASIVSGAPGANQTGLAYDGGTGKYTVTNGWGVTHNYYFGLIKTRQNS